MQTFSQGQSSQLKVLALGKRGTRVGASPKMNAQSRNRQIYCCIATFRRSVSIATFISLPSLKTLISGDRDSWLHAQDTISALKKAILQCFFRYVGS